MADDAAEYRSPKRCLAHAFRLSRERWKRKAGERLSALRAARIRNRDLLVSRDLWKQKALHCEAILRRAGLLPTLVPTDETPTPTPRPEVTPPLDPTEPSKKKRPRRR